jgi:diguanylate cyclase (GGDEF)-like protein
MVRGIWLVLIIIPVLLFSKDYPKDSLAQIQAKSSEQSIETLWQLADAMTAKDPERAVVYINMAIILSQKTGDLEAQAISLNRLSSLQLQRGHLDEALAADQKALQIYHKQPGLSGYVDALDNNAQVYNRLIRSLEHDNMKVRKRYIGIFAILLLFITFLFVSMYQMKSIANKKLIIANKEVQNKNEELSNAYQILDLVARKDPLTNLSNRRDILEKLKYAQITFERNHKAFSIIMADVDLFKEINDTFGHDAGDFVLIFLSKLMQKTLRKQDIISRWGGDEFLILLPDTDIKGGKVVAEKIRANLALKACIYGQIHINMTLSLGVCSYTENGDIDVCIRKADEALYSSKKNGKNQVTIGEDC